MCKHPGLLAIFSLILPALEPLAASADEYDNGIEAYQAGNYTQALQQWKTLAKLSHAQATYNLGFMYEFGYGVAPNDAQAFNYYLRAAQQGHAQAQHTVAWMYERGKGVKANRAQAAHWTRIWANSTKLGNAERKNELDTKAFLDQLIFELKKADARYDAQKQKAARQNPPVELEASNQTS